MNPFFKRGYLEDAHVSTFYKGRTSIEHSLNMLITRIMHVSFVFHPTNLVGLGSNW